MISDYIPVLILVLAAIGFAAGTLITSVLLGKRGRNSAAKDMAYECGKDPIGPTHSRFSIKFYLVAMPTLVWWGPPSMNCVSSTHPPGS